MARNYPRVAITADMLEAADRLAPSVDVARTKTSPVDTVAGILGEFAFAAWAFGDWRANRVGFNKGESDFDGVEVKTSVFEFQEDFLNLLVREDYGRRRKPPFYVQVFLDLPRQKAWAIPVGTEAVLAGWATGDELQQAPLRRFRSKLGGQTEYRCFHIPVLDLHDMGTFQEAFKAWQAGRGQP